jgi:hypothetical protein
MASTLHSITALQLSDSFNEWFLRSNDLISVVNKINVYDVEGGFGLAKYRAIDGTSTFRINIGQGQTEFDGTLTGVTGQADEGGSTPRSYGLRFLDPLASTSANNPDVLGNARKILAVDVTGLPDAIDGTSSPVASDDYIMIGDTSSATGGVFRVRADSVLPYAVSGDHRFTGNIFFDGTYTTINSTELFIDDTNIYLGTCGANGTGDAGLNDVNLDGAGIVVVGLSGDKEFILDTSRVASDGSNADLIAWKPNIGIDFTTAKAFTNAMDIFGLSNAETQITISHIGVSGENFNIRAFKAGDVNKLKFGHNNTLTGVSADGLEITEKGTVIVTGLSGDVVVSGVKYESSFSHTPRHDAVPSVSSVVTGTTLDKYLNYGWQNRELIYQVGHGFTTGTLIKFYQSGVGSTYERAASDNVTNAEVVAIVEDAKPGATNDYFVAVYGGLVDLGGVPACDGMGGQSLAPGEAYFLTTAGACAGGFTAVDPETAGEIRKPVLIGVTGDKAVFVNYVGTEVPSDAGNSFDFVEFDNTTNEFADNTLVRDMSFRNKIINGDFALWQRSRDLYGLDFTNHVTGDFALGMGGAGHVVVSGTTSGGKKVRFGEATGVTGYWMDQWAIISKDLGRDTVTADCFQFGHSFGNGLKDVGGSEPQHYIRVVNSAGGGGAPITLAQRIENVTTLAGPLGSTDVTVSYYLRGTSMDGGSVGFKCDLYQVFAGTSMEGNATFHTSGRGISYGAGATAAVAVLTDGSTGEAGHTFDAPANFTLQTNRFQLRPLNGFSGSINTGANWLELRFEIPEGWGACCGIDLSRVQLEGGAGRTRFEDRPIATEKELCERYYSVYDVSMGGFGANGLTLATRLPMRVEPYNPGLPFGFIAGASGSDVGTVQLAADHTVDLRGVAAAAVTDIKHRGSDLRVERKIIDAQSVGATGTTGQVEFSTTYHIDTSIR